MTRSIRDGEVVRGEEIVHRLGDGTQLWLRYDSSPIYDEEGRITAGVLVAYNITERKQAEEALREAETRYRTLVEQIPAVTYIQNIGETSESTYVSPQMETMLGYKPEECTSDPDHWIKIMHPADRERVLDEDRRTNESGEPFRMEYRQFARDGRVVWVRDEAVLVRGEEGEPSYWLGIQYDITERKQAQKEIGRRTIQQTIVSELGLRALASNDLQLFMDEAVVFVALTLGVEYCKIVELVPSGEELLMRAGAGWRKGLVGSAKEGAGFESQAGYALLSEESVIAEDLSTETRFHPSWLLQEHGVVSGMTVVIHRREGPFGVLCAYTTSHRIFTQDDQNFLQAVANVLAMAIERKEAQEKIEEVREAERSRIARDLHDEALQDLSGALVDAQRLKAISTEPEASRLSERLLATLDRVEPHVRGAIYDLSLEREQDRPFDVLLETMVELHRTMAPHLQIALDIQEEILEGSLGETGREILRIIGEALTNARRHAQATNVWVRVGISEGILFGEVEDDGRGFDPSQEEPTLPATPATTGGGGIGIRAMRERANQIGGELKTESEPGQGTKVRFELVLQRELEQADQEEEEEVHILLVDDHASIREALGATFEGEEGFKVVGQAGSMAEAKRMLEEMQQPIDLAVIDLGLPDGYGADLIKELREKNPRAQALVLSASLDRARIAGAVEQGAAGVLSKTAHLDEVVEAVSRLRAGETLMPVEEVVDLLRFAGSRREEEIEARRSAEKLTPREIEVLQALAEGLGSEQIAQRLHISLRTQRNHMANILSKLGVHSQLQALVFALRYGVVEIP